MFHTEIAGLLSKSAVFALRMHASRVVGGVQGGHGKPIFLLGAGRALFRNARFCPVCLPGACRATLRYSQLWPPFNEVWVGGQRHAAAARVLAPPPS